MRSRIPLSVFLPLLALPLAPAIALEARAPAAQEPFYESVEVDVANVEVYVTDRSGRPVPGLTRADFQLWEDGRPAEITHFLAENVDSLSPGEEGSVGAPTSAAAADPGEGRTMAFFFNNLHLDSVARIPVFAGIAKTLGTLAPRDRVVIFTYDRSFAMQIFAAADRPAIDRALAKIRARVPGGFEMRAQEDELNRRLQSAGDPVVMQSAQDDVKLAKEETEIQYKKSLEALEAATVALSGLPGPKALVYITGSLPFPMDPTSLVRGYLEKASAAANANRVTLYGLGVPTRGDAYGKAVKTQGMIYLADRTGGLAYVDPFDPSVLFTRMRSDLTTYYSLGYAPSKQAKAGHRIEVRVDRPDLEVRYRRTAKAKSGGEEALDRAMTALYLGESANRLAVEAELGAVRPDAKGMLKVDLAIRVPFSHLALLPEEKSHKGRVRLFFASRNERGEVSGLTQVVLPLSIPREQLAAALADKVVYSTQLLLRPEAGTVMVGVRDELGNVDSALVVPWSPPPA